MKAGKIDYELEESETGSVLLRGTDENGVDKTLLIFHGNGTVSVLKNAELDGLETDFAGRIIIE